VKCLSHQTERVREKCAALVLGFILLDLTGCTTYIVRTLPFTSPASVYPGTSEDARYITHPSSDGMPFYFLPYGILDIVPSAVADTLLLPFDLASLKRDQRDEKQRVQPSVAPESLTTNHPASTEK